MVRSYAAKVTLAAMTFISCVGCHRADRSKKLVFVIVPSEDNPFFKAEADAAATWDVLVAQVVRYPQLGNNVDTILKHIGEEPLVDYARRFVMENGVEIFNFGKYKGRSVADVLKAEPQYYDWMMKGDFPLHTKQKLTEIFNRTMLKKG